MKSLNRRQFVYGTGALMGSALVGCGNGQDPKSDPGVTVFQNGMILPVDATFSEHEAFAISGNKILAVGSRAEVLAAAGRGARSVDLDGRVVLPGFIEPHMHFALLAGLGHLEDIGPFQRPTFDDALDAVRQLQEAAELTVVKLGRVAAKPERNRHCHYRIFPHSDSSSTNAK